MDNFKLAEMALINLVGEIYRDVTYEDIHTEVNIRLREMIIDIGKKWDVE